MKYLRKLFNIPVFFLLLFIAGAIFLWSYEISPISGSSDKTAFEIKKGESLTEIGKNLKENGLIKDPFIFKIVVFVKGISKQIQAGSFNLSPSMSAIEIAKTLTKGTNDLKVTIIEGLRYEEIGILLKEKGFNIDLTSWSKTIKGDSLEGKLFPDTYFLPKGADQSTILKLLEKNFSSKILNVVNSSQNTEQLSLNEILIYSSIVEREVRTGQDRKIVAGILIKRQKNNWPLQADATVQYAIATQNSKLKTPALPAGRQNFDWWPRNLTRNDLTINSPYNTYKFKGLPPGPICNPSLSSVKAVLEPQESDYWFYLSDTKGDIHYAKTDAEQVSNIDKYLAP